MAEEPTNQFTAPHVSSSRLRRSEGDLSQPTNLEPARAYAAQVERLTSVGCGRRASFARRPCRLICGRAPGRSFQTAPPGRHQGLSGARRFHPFRRPLQGQRVVAPMDLAPVDHLRSRGCFRSPFHSAASNSLAPVPRPGSKCPACAPVRSQHGERAHPRTQRLRRGRFVIQ